MSEAVEAGIHRRTLYAMLDAGLIERMSRGVYRLASLPYPDNADLAATAARIPSGVVCLISALHYHRLTTQIPHAIDIAIEQGKQPPKFDYPPLHVYYFSGDAFNRGIDTINISGVDVKIYNPEKSIADMFKYRNKLGIDVAVEALRTWWPLRSSKPATLMEYAKMCRVDNVIRPYVETLI